MVQIQAARSRTGKQHFLLRIHIHQRKESAPWEVPKTILKKVLLRCSC